MKVLRTPDERFADLPDFPFAPHYVEIDDGDGGRLRVHYLDEGPADAAAGAAHARRAVVVVPLPAHDPGARRRAGHRCIAPDLVGFGRSDKPTRAGDYTYARHVDWMRRALFDELDLRDITFFGQDWGGLDRPAARRRSSPTASPRRRRQHRPARPATARRPTRSSRGRSSRQEVAGRSPSAASSTAAAPSDARRRGGRRLRRAVPRRHLQGRRPAVPVARADRRPTIPPPPTTSPRGRCSDASTEPFLCAFSDGDPITKGGERRVPPRRCPGTKGQPHTTIEGGGHFLQEDRGPSSHGSSPTSSTRRDRR